MTRNFDLYICGDMNIIFELQCWSGFALLLIAIICSRSGFRRAEFWDIVLYYCGGGVLILFIIIGFVWRFLSWLL